MAANDNHTDDHARAEPPPPSPAAPPQIADPRPAYHRDPMSESPPPAVKALSPRAQAILQRVEQEALEVAGAAGTAEPTGTAEPVAHPSHDLARPRPQTADPPEPHAAANPAGEPVDTDHLLALVNALARRTEVARRQLEELTSALDVLTRGLAGPPDAGPPAAPPPPAAPAPAAHEPSPPLRRPGTPAPPPSVRWP
jgi:2-oxoglutarate dehydrogenase E2 component (dihydrolipoamide succinyltransferase)